MNAVLDRPLTIEDVLGDHWLDIKWRLNNLYRIVDEHGKSVPFQLNEEQEYVIDNWHTRLVILKARQLGMSTLLEILQLDQALFNSNHTGVVIADTLPNAGKLFGKIEHAMKHLPRDLLAALPVKSTTARTGVEFQHGSTVHVSTSSRGGTVQLLHVCLAGDTEIVLKDAEVKAIRDVSVGDLVLTSKGSYQPVRSVIKNRLSDLGETMYSVDAFGHYAPLKLTGNHQVMTREKGTGKATWTAAKDLKSGDYMAYPVREPKNRLRDGCLPIGGMRIKADFNLGRIVGLYLSEGSIRRTETTFSIHRKEVVDVLRLLDDFNDFYTSRRTWDSANSLTSMVTVNGQAFADFLTRFFGSGPDKRIPDAVFGYGRSFLDGLIRGYFDGDGSYLDTATVQATSIRRQLLQQMKMLLISLRFGVPTMYRSDAGERYGRNCQETWVLKLNGAGNWKFREYFGLEMPPVPDTWRAKWRVEHGKRPDGKKLWRRGANQYWMRVKSVETCEPEEFVYDLALEKDPHNYVTVNGVVHNSEFGKIARKYPERASEIITGAFESVPIDGCIVVESTAEGAAGAFYDLAMPALKRQEANGPETALDWRVLFFPWYIKAEYRLSPEDAATVVISDAMLKYFREKEAETGAKFDLGQRAWYVKKRETLGSNIRREMPTTAMEAFEQAVEGAVFGEQMTILREQGRITNVPLDREFDVNTFWDLGVADATAIWLHQRIGLQNRWFKYFEGSGRGLGSWWRLLEEYRREHGYKWGEHYLPHDADAEILGENITTKHRILAAAGMERIKVVPRVAEKSIAIDLVRQKLPADNWFDREGCVDGIKCLDGYQYEWNVKQLTWSNQPLHNWACLAGETLIRTLSGWKPIASLVGTDFHVWAYSEAERRLVPAKAGRCWLAKTVHETVRVDLDHGRTIRCTLDHRFMLRDGSWKQAQRLVAGDSLMPFHDRTESGRSYARVNLTDGCYAEEHRYVYSRLVGNLKDGHHIHHLDGDKHNNEPANLEQLSIAEHRSRHSSTPEHLAFLRTIGKGGNRKNSRIAEVNKMRSGDAHHTKQPGYYSDELKARIKDGMSTALKASETTKVCSACSVAFTGNWKRLYCCHNCASRAGQAKRTGGVGFRLAPKHSDDCSRHAENHKVIAVTTVLGECEVYDISVPGAESFVAEGVVVHNSNGSDAWMQYAQGYSAMSGDYDSDIERFINRDRRGY